MTSARFTFIGTLDANTKIDSNGYFLREGKTKERKGKNGETISGNPYASINLQVIQEKNNRGYVECFGSVSKTINTLDTNNSKTEINWDDRLDEDVVKDVANFKKTIIKNGDEKKEFISSYDGVKYIAEHIDELKNKRVVVTGQRKKNVYNGKISDRFEFSSIRVIDEDEEVNNRLTVNMEVLFDKDSIDTANWKDEHKLFLNGWTEEYMSDVKENRYVPQQIVFDCSKVNWENEKHVNQVKFRLKMFGCELVDGKVVVKLKSKKIYSVGVITTFVNGQEKLEFDESMLTDVQKEALELGLKTLDDFRPSGSIFGNRVVVYKLRDFDLRKDGKYENGYIEEEDLTLDDFEEKLYVVTEEKTEEEVVENTGDDSGEEDDDDLFS